MRTETVKIDAITLDSANVRRHSKRNLDAIAASLKQFGQQKPVVVDADGVVVAGNGTLEAARSIGWDEIVVARSGLKGAARVAYAIADNRTAELAEWDEAELAELLAGLQNDPAIDECLTGFDAAEIDGMIARALNPDGVVEDEVPDVPEEPVAQSGDLWLLGKHRVLCGDSTKAEDVERACGELARMVFTDPPYGVDIQERDMAQAEVRGRRKDGKGVTNDDLTGEALRDFLAAAFENVLAHTDAGACWYVCAPGGADCRHTLNILAALGVARHSVVWVKDRFVMGRADYHYQHESIIYGWTPGGPHHPIPTRDQSTVWQFARPGRSPEHPTMKPVALVAKAIVNSSDAGELILDPFLGSGTTLIAAEQLGRRCYGIDIEPRYVDVALKRWMNLTSKSPIRESDGASFADLIGKEDDGTTRISTTAYGVEVTQG